MVGGERQCPERSAATVKLLQRRAGIFLLGFTWRCVQNQSCVNPGLRRGRVWGGFGRGGRDDARAARQWFDSFGVVIVVVIVVFISFHFGGSVS